jgi:hypothetical protein
MFPNAPDNRPKASRPRSLDDNLDVLTGINRGAYGIGSLGKSDERLAKGARIDRTWYAAEMQNDRFVP